MEEKIKIGDKEFTVKELLYVDVIDLEGVEKKELAKKMIMISTGISEEELNQLSLKEGIELQKKINEVSGLDLKDFQNPTDKEE